MDRGAEVEAVLQARKLQTTGKQVKANLNFASALARPVELP